MRVFLVFLAITCAISECDLPANNTQRVEWLNHLTVMVQQTLARHNIPSWISHGTLLGAVRDNATIPWTGDADLDAFANEIKHVCDYTTSIWRDFDHGGLIVYDCEADFFRVCFKKGRAPSPSRPPAVEFQDAGYPSEAKLEVYGCVRRPDGLYTIPKTPCVWNFSGLFPLRQYQLSPRHRPLGPNQAEYWLNRFYGKNWSKPHVYAGNKDPDANCEGTG